MNISELKAETIRQFAIKINATKDEKILKIILAFLNDIKTDGTNSISLSRHYDQIKARYGNVLKKFAE